MEARTIIQALPGELAKAIIHSVTFVFEATPAEIREILPVKSIDAIREYSFAYEVLSRVNSDEFVKQVGDFIKAYQDTSETISASVTAYDLQLKQWMQGILSLPDFTAAYNNLNLYIKNANRHFLALAKKNAGDLRDQNKQQLDNIVSRINEILIETKARAENNPGADKQRFLVMETLHKSSLAILIRCQNLSPQQTITELCEVITQGIESILETPYGAQSTTLAKLQEVLARAKKYTMKGGSPIISHQGAPAQTMIAEIKTFFDEQAGNVGDAWVNKNGVSRILLILKDGDKSFQKKFEEIQAIATERLNARTWLGYGNPIDRPQPLNEFYFGIKTANVDKLQEVKKSLLGASATSALRMSQ